MCDYHITKYRNLIIEPDLMINLDQVRYIRYHPDDNEIQISDGNVRHWITKVSPDEYKKFIEDLNK
jgi:hypothetical protein